MLCTSIFSNSKLRVTHNLHYIARGVGIYEKVKIEMVESNEVKKCALL